MPTVSFACIISLYTLIKNYIADLPPTSLRSPSSESDNKPVPFAWLRSLILLLSYLSFAFLTRFYEARAA